ncbi:hypothetical protein [Elizabethkingia anophelis]|uniref:hypothetical protein n=1 Tax=Elizabethkingia anophelis TaxID=1117645 RepID=UPI001628F27E|nr:hypothetical protein [Elizabethkingia anophelis]MCT4306051.1 hypothetical protein [Elizabethkingia anophelis]
MTPHEELKQLFAHRKPIDVAIEVSGFTSHRTTVIDELTESEVLELLSIHNHDSIEETEDALRNEIILKKMRSKIIALAEKEKVKEPNSWDKFNNWMLLSSRFKKHLNAHNMGELQLLFKQLQALKTNNRRSAKKPMSKAWWKEGIEKINMN